MSEAAAAVAHEVIAEVGKGKRPVLGQIIRKHGYKPSISRSPGKVTRTESYKAVLEPVIDRMIQQRDKAIARMDATIDKAHYHQAVEAVDKLTKNIQLLSGGATSNIAIGVKKLTDDELQNLADGGQS